MRVRRNIRPGSYYEYVRGYGIAFCGAMYGCSLMYLSLDPVLCDTTVDECDC